MVRLDHRFSQMHPHHLRWMLSPDRTHKYIYSILFIHSHSPRQLFWLRKWTHTHTMPNAICILFLREKKACEIYSATNFRGNKFLAILFHSICVVLFTNFRKSQKIQPFSFYIISSRVGTAYFSPFLYSHFL